MKKSDSKPKPSYKWASQFILPFGQHKGKKIDKVAETDDGLLYLDWLNGQNYVNGDLKLAIETYLTDPAIAKDLANLVKE